MTVNGRSFLPDGRLAPVTLISLTEDAIRAWRESRQADTAERHQDREEVAMINTFGALREALVSAGVANDTASALFRELVAASEVLR